MITPTRRALLACALLAGAPPVARAQGPWQTAIGLSAGYTRAHLRGLGFVVDFTALAAPGVGSAGIGSPPTLFAVFPVVGRFALEPGLDLHRSQSQGTTAFSGNVSVRLNYAVAGGWYAAAGGTLIYTQQAGSDGVAQAGANVAWGYRFHLAGSFSGRVETNFTMLKEREGVPFAINTFGLMVGAAVPLQ